MTIRAGMEAIGQGGAAAAETMEPSMHAWRSISGSELANDTDMASADAVCNVSSETATLPSFSLGARPTGTMRLPSVSSGSVSDGTESPIAWSSVTAALQGGAWPPFAAYQSVDDEDQILHEAWQQQLQDQVQEHFHTQAEHNTADSARWAWHRAAAGSERSSGMHTPCTPMVRMGSPCLSQNELQLVDWAYSSGASTASVSAQAEGFSSSIGRSSSTIPGAGHVTYTFQAGPSTCALSTQAASEQLHCAACADEAGTEQLQEIDAQQPRQMVDQGVQTSTLTSSTQTSTVGWGGNVSFGVSHGYGSLLRGGPTPIRVGGQQPHGGWSSIPRYPPVFLRPPVTITGAAVTDSTRVAASPGSPMADEQGSSSVQYTAPWSHGHVTHVCAGTSIPLAPRQAGTHSTVAVEDGVAGTDTQVQHVQTSNLMGAARVVDSIESDLDTLMQDVMDWVSGPGAQLSLPHPLPNSNGTTAAQTPRAFESPAASLEADMTAVVDASTPDVQEAGLPPISRLAGLLLRGMHRPRHTGIAPAPETPVTPTLVGLGAAEPPAVLTSSVVSHTRIRQLLNTRQWANEPEEGNPLQGLHIPDWAARFAPPQPTTPPHTSDLSDTSTMQQADTSVMQPATPGRSAVPASPQGIAAADHSLFSHQHPLSLLPVASASTTSQTQTPAHATATAGGLAAVAPVTSVVDQPRPRFATLLASYLQRRADQQLHAHIAAAGVTAPYADTAANVLRPPSADSNTTGTFLNPPQYGGHLAPSDTIVHAATAAPAQAGFTQLHSPHRHSSTPVRTDSPVWDTASLLPLPPLLSPTAASSFTARRSETSPELLLPRVHSTSSTEQYSNIQDGRGFSADDLAASGPSHMPSPLSAPLPGLPRVITGRQSQPSTDMGAEPVYHEGPTSAPATTAATVGQVVRRLTFLSEDRTPRGAAISHAEGTAGTMGQSVHTNDVVLRLSPTAAATSTAAASGQQQASHVLGALSVPESLSIAHNAAAHPLLRQLQQDASILDEVQQWMTAQGVCWEAECVQSMVAWLQQE